jgi:hypothetical protein
MGGKEHNQSVQDQMNRIKELKLQKDELYNKLERSLSIQSLWPEAFTLGKVSSFVHHEPIYMYTPIEALKRAKLTVRAGEHEKTWPMNEVPKILAIFHLESVLGKTPHDHVNRSIIQSIVEVLKSN